MWWPFRRRQKEEKKKPASAFRRFITGFIIGTAVASVIGRRILDEKEE